MTLRYSLAYILSNYLASKREKFAGHPMAVFLRTGFRDAVLNVVGNEERLIIKGSAGQGTWARGPWLAMFDPLVTSSAQSGYYPVYLFREDMQGVYLSLNQGMTEAKELYKSDAKTTLRAMAQNYRAMLGRQVGTFTTATIDLAPTAATNDTAFYEAANICAKYYDAGDLPSEESLVHDLREMIGVYRMLLDAETNSHSAATTEPGEPGSVYTEDARKLRIHKRIERNPNLVKAVKQVQGHTCNVCGIDFESRYGDIGKGFIEAHHLKPVASFKGSKVQLDPVKDFAVLCSNCHRMVHRSEWLHDIEQFKIQHYKP